jgi:hypothetical protein
MLQRPGLGPAQCLRAGSDLGGGPDAYDTRWVEAVNVTQRSLGVRSGCFHRQPERSTSFAIT